MRPIPILAMVMTFRERLAATIRAARPILEEPGVLVVGSEVPNLLEPGAAATLVVSKDLDVGVPVDRYAAVKRRLDELVGLSPSKEEPSVDEQYRRLRPDLRHAIRSNLTILSLLQPRPGMPDPTDRRADVAALLRRLEAGEVDA